MVATRWRTPALGLVICVVLIAGHSGVQAKPRKVKSKGIKYTLALTPPGADDPVRLCIEPGKEAWLEPAWGGGNRPAIRSGRGLKWSFIRDTRKGVIEGFLFLEVEPLEGRSFEDEADVYRGRLRSLWESAGATFERVTNEQATGPMKICGQRVKGRRLLQEVREQRDGRRYGATSVLFPLHGHLVVLTGYGKFDPLPAAMRAIGNPPKSWDAKRHVYHCVDFVGDPAAATFVVLPLPAGYDVVPGTPSETDEDLVNRFRRNREGSTPGSVTLQRFHLSPDITTKVAVERWAVARKTEGVAFDEPQPFELDGNEGWSIGYVRGGEAEGEPGRGWLVAWMSEPGVYALQWETTEMDAQIAERARAEVVLALREIKTWHVQPPR